jgi:tRNA (cmo5U34)-methyltransferase
MPADRLFSRRRRRPADFTFGKQTAAVFDDMLGRSVPFYEELQRMTGELAADFALPGTNLYDLGCSTGTTLLMLDAVVPQAVRFVGVDASAEMLKKARAKFRAHHLVRPCQLVCHDLNRGARVTNASVAILTLSLQFIRPPYRQRLIRSIADGLHPQGCLLLIEKVLPKVSTLNRLFIKYYYAFKQRNGYSELEIAQKREALENVLIPYRLEENMELLFSNGFSQCEVFFKWYNFCGLMALK